MAKIKQSPKLPPETRQEQLLTAARELFISKGYRDTTTDEIARRAGVTKGALYYHFGSKEDIMCGLVKRVVGRHFERMDAVLARGGSPAQILRLLFEDAGGCREGRFRENIDFLVQAMRIPRIKKYLNREFARAVEKFADGMDSRYGNRKQLRDLAVFIFSLHHGLRIRNVLDPDIVDVPAQVKLFERLVVSAYRKSPVKMREK